VRPGRYLLECDAGFESATERLRGRQWIEVGSADIEGIQIVLARPEKIEGKVRAERGARLPEGLHGVLIPREEAPTHQSGGFAALRPDGTITFDSVYEGRYDLALAKFQGELDDFYVKSIRFGDDDALNTGLDVLRETILFSRSKVSQRLCYTMTKSGGESKSSPRGWKSQREERPQWT